MGKKFDNRKCNWTIPAALAVMKGGHFSQNTNLARVAKSYSNPLNQSAGKIEKFVFPSDSNAKKQTNQQTANMGLRRMGYCWQLVSHG